MDSMMAMMLGEANRGKPMKVFDWDKAAKLIAERKPDVASAGLQGDWGYTGGEIYADGKPIDQSMTYTYLASTWATPELEMDGERQDCYRMQDETEGWDSGTYWPDSAVAILGGAA